MHSYANIDINMQDKSDSQLISEYLKGNSTALETLISRYLKQIYGYVYRRVGTAANAEDITKDVFVKAWKNIKTFEIDRSFRAWLFAIARNSMIDFLKKKRAIPFSHFDQEEGENALEYSLVNMDPQPDEISERGMVREMISKAAGSLSEKYREVLSFRYNEDLSFREIAERVDEPLHTVKSRHRRALIALREILKGSSF